MPVLELQEIAAAVNGMILAAGERMHISGFKIDSREVCNGDLFFCIVGPNNDGHDFLGDALQRGASTAIISRDVYEGLGKKIQLIKVDDTTEALQELARHVRRKRQIEVVGITGSTGKTTTKEMTYTALSPSFRTSRSRGNLNNLYGLPLSLLELDDDIEVSVLEMGMSYSGELKKITDIADPTVGVLMSIEAVHLEHFRSIEEIAKAKAELFETMSRNSIAVYNVDNEHVRKIAMDFPGKKLAYGFGQNANVSAHGLKDSIRKGIFFDCSCLGEDMHIHLPLFGIHNVYNALAALSICASLRGDIQKACRALAHFKPFDMRGVVLPLRRGITLIDDTYNSNPAAMEMVLQSVKKERTDGRKVIISGDMLELGQDGPLLHEKIGERIADAGASLLVAVGNLSAHTAGAAARLGVPQCHLFRSSEEAADEIISLIKENDLVLVKGSRGMKMEVIVEKLSAEIGEEC